MSATQEMPQTQARGNMVIEPTVGRIVWYWPNGAPTSNKQQPLAAMVVFVHNDRCVNLTMWTETGTHAAATNVLLMQEGDPAPSKAFCQWMPYQLSQAKRHMESAAS